MDGFIPKLVEILDTDPEENCRFKAVSAISCLIRDNPEGQVTNSLTSDWFKKNL